MKQAKLTIYFLAIAVLCLFVFAQLNTAQAATISQYSAKKQITYDTSANGANLENSCWRMENSN